MTRNWEDITSSDISWINYDEGSYYFNGYKIANEDSTYAFFVSASNNNYHAFGSNFAGSKYEARAFTDSGNDGTIQGLSLTKGQYVDAAFAYATNDMVSYTDGSSAGTDTSVDPNPGPFDEFQINADRNGGNEWNGVIGSIRYYDERLTDEQLEDMSNGVFP